MFSVTCQQRALYEKVQLVSRGVSGRSTQPIQSNILLQVIKAESDAAETEGSGYRLNLVATDLEYIGISTSMEVEAAEEGAITVPARVLAEMVGRLSAGTVTMNVDDSNTLDIKGGNYQSQIRGLPADDFEQLPAPDDPLRFEMPHRDLLRVLQRTVFSTSSDETRPILTGALFKTTGNKLEVVATDTYRLALCQTLLPAETEREVEAIISRRALQEVLRVLHPDAEEMVSISISDNQVEFVVHDTVIGSRLIEGQFVNYPKVTPAGGDKRIGVNAIEFADALDRAEPIARQDAHRVVLQIAEDEMTIRAQSQDVGRTEESVAVSLEGEPTEIAFNANFLLQMLEACDADEVVMELSGPLNSGLLRPSDDDAYLYVLMPMQIM